MSMTCAETMNTAILDRVEESSVGMGLAVLAAAPARLTAILGSCVGVAIYCPELRLGMLSHVVLPRSNGRRACPAKFADSAVSYMRTVLQGRGAKPGRLIAKIAGGAGCSATPRKPGSERPTCGLPSERSRRPASPSPAARSAA